MDTPAFVTELMGVTFYCHLHALFDDILADEPEVCERAKALLDEITIDEMAHAFYKMFFNDMPEFEHLFNIKEMIKDGQKFDFNNVPEHMIERSWIPSYCKI